MEPGTYTLTVSKSGYATVTQTLVIVGDATINVTLIPTRSCSITVDDGAASDPQGISGAYVTIDGDTANKKTTGSAGGCTATLTDGKHTVVVTNATGYKDKTTEITVDSTHTSFTISLEEEEGG